METTYDAKTMTQTWKFAPVKVNMHPENSNQTFHRNDNRKYRGHQARRSFQNNWASPKTLQNRRNRAYKAKMLLEDELKRKETEKKRIRDKDIRGQDVRDVVVDDMFNGGKVTRDKATGKVSGDTTTDDKLEERSKQNSNEKPPIIISE